MPVEAAKDMECEVRVVSYKDTLMETNVHNHGREAEADIDEVSDDEENDDVAEEDDDPECPVVRLSKADRLITGGEMVDV